MPLNTLRLNQRQLHPNDRITFIKPLPGPTSSIADIILKKIAAICYPIMKAHSLSITTLEEFPPNREFMGRNFNNGEVIQLVLRRMVSRSGPSTTTNNGPVTTIDHHSSTFVSSTEHAGWLSLRSIEMVMMHELAHCIHMNHSKLFWKVRDDYASHLRLLWSRGYTGEGMWGRGQSLLSGDFTSSAPRGDEFTDLCGGVYRGRRARKRKPKQSYAERKKAKLERTERKFGAGHGMDAERAEAERVLLEGRPVAGKPRVAGSKRGRELRAAAALLRFEKAKVAQEREGSKVETADEETESAEEEEEEEEEEGEELRDEKGERIVDAHGNGLRKVCGDDEGGTEQANEMEELRGLADEEVDEHALTERKEPDDPEEDPSTACPICTLVNAAGSVTCGACGHALSGGWKCDSKACMKAGYVNNAAAERCGLCGRLRHAPA